MKFLFAFIIGAAIGTGIHYGPRYLEPKTHVSFTDYLAMNEDAAPGILKFDAPSTCEVGELVRFETSGSTVNSYRWKIVPESDDFLVVEGGELAVFSGREPGTYTIIVAAATDNVVALHVHMLRVTSEASPEHVINRWLKSVEYDDPVVKKDIVSQLATGFLSLSVDNSSPDEMNVKAAALFPKILGDDLPKWKEFLVALQNFLDRKYDAGELTNTQDYQNVWREISDALSNAKL